MANCICANCSRRMDCTGETLCELCEGDLAIPVPHEINPIGYVEAPIVKETRTWPLVCPWCGCSLGRGQDKSYRVWVCHNLDCPVTMLVLDVQHPNSPWRRSNVSV